MNELETSCVTMGRGLAPKDLWRQGSFFQARGHVQMNVGRQQQAGKEDYTDYFVAMMQPRVFVLYAEPVVQETRCWRTTDILAHSYLAFIRAALSKRHDWRGKAVAEHIELTARRTLADSFFDPVKQLEKRGHLDAALDVLYDRVDDLLKRQNFGALDLLLRQTRADSLSAEILLGVLTATLPARSKLASRSKFFADAETSIKERGEWENGLLAGLES